MPKKFELYTIKEFEAMARQLADASADIEKLVSRMASKEDPPQPQLFATAKGNFDAAKELPFFALDMLKEQQKQYGDLEKGIPLQDQIAGRKKRKSPDATTGGVKRSKRVVDKPLKKASKKKSN